MYYLIFLINLILFNNNLLFAKEEEEDLFKEELLEEKIEEKDLDFISSRCWSNSNGQNERWINEGEIVDRGKYWYLCSGGKLVPAGCIDEKEKRIPLNKTFINGNFLVECILWSNLIKIKTVGCLENNKTFFVGENWLNGEFLWECAWEGIYLKKRQKSCVFNETKIINVGEQKIEGKTVYECQQNEYGLLNLVAIECISDDGKRYKIGKQWTEGDFIFYCKKRIDSSNCEKTCIGCFHKNQNLFDGDRFQLNETVFQCEIRPKRHLLKPVGCVSEGRIERVVNCKWEDNQQQHHQQSTELTTTNYRVQRQCIIRKGRAIIESLGCVYVKDGIKRLFLRPETYTIWIEEEKEKNKNKIAIACITENNEQILYKFNLEEIEKKLNYLN
uniref:Abnormal cell migration protein 18-like fibronectin type I domain-containing protein n=1 Tax=Meloidogyne enterolobii TaxID=390850 RepID=A0A6V7W4D4_MELEN|nr:unnamed protein product [Meloidogyne enterolobii]